MAAHRGRVFVRYYDPTQIDPVQLVSVDEKDVTVVPNPAAQFLGRRKAGVKERSSAKKAASCRRNASRPRPGRRARPPMTSS